MTKNITISTELASNAGYNSEVEVSLSEFIDIVVDTRVHTFVADVVHAISSGIEFDLNRS